MSKNKYNRYACVHEEGMSKPEPRLYHGPITKYSGFTKDIKREIRKRDTDCQVCHANPHPVALHTHHINYNKEDSHPMNLLMLCKVCHEKSNKHRHDWMLLCSEIMTVRFPAEYRRYLAASKWERVNHRKIPYQKK